MNRIRIPSPAMIVACLALFVALSGVAGPEMVVPLIKKLGIKVE